MYTSDYQTDDFKSFDTEARLKDINQSIRLGFIRKVYGILSIQLLITTILCLIAMISKSFQSFMINNISLAYLMIFLTIILPIIIVCCRDTMSKVPINYIILLLFTFAESYLVSFICSLTNPKIVFMAAFMTFAMVVSLTIYAITTSTDMTLNGSILFIGGCALILFSFFLIFTNNKLLHIIFCIAGIIILGFYLIYDTQLIIGNKSYCVEMDDYILGSFMLYTDIVSLFLYILQLLQLLNSGD